MNKIVMFKLSYCGYCRRALQLIEQAMENHPEYKCIEIEYVDEEREQKRARQHDYYYVPTFYIGSEKIHEGPVTDKDIDHILRRALES
jgi:thioredoxin 1